jgi:regulator of sirC expression with transglutaminase-like and TPR domain
MLRVQQYLRATRPSAPDEVRDEGLILYALDRYSECAEAMRMYLELDPFAPDAPQVLSLLKKIDLSRGTNS